MVQRAAKAGTSGHLLNSTAFKDTIAEETTTTQTSGGLYSQFDGKMSFSWVFRERDGENRGL